MASHISCRTGALAASILAVSAAQCRDKLKWPFSADSVWNTAIGSSARYVPANIQPGGLYVFPDSDWFVVTTPSDPIVPWYKPGSWDVRCAGTAPPIGPIVNTSGLLHVPATLLVPDADPPNTPNNCAAFLQPDGRTLVQMNPLARCVPGGPVYGWATPGEDNGTFQDILGPGTLGGHGGSGLSSLGGAIRLGELLESTPAITHSLKLELFAHVYYYGQPPAFRWPAVQCDGYAFDPSSPLQYNGSNPSFMPGSLLAIPPAVAQGLSMKTVPGAKMLFALVNYGGYIADDAAWNVYQFAVEQGVEAEFFATYNITMNTGPGSPWYDDIQTLFTSLSIVDNNTPTSPGGGGTPLQPAPPPFC